LRASPIWRPDHPGRVRWTGGRAWWPVVSIGLLGWPLVVRSDYTIGVAVTVLIYVGLALSFDLITGRVGQLSFAHPAFFGIGAYVAALIALHTDLGFGTRLVAAAAAASVAAIVIGIPCFRLSLHTFAMGTLGFAQIAYVVALGWQRVTRGPLCLPGVPPVDFGLGHWRWSATHLVDYYYVGLALAALTFVIVRQLADGRVGRAWTAIREDELLAASVGVPVLKYKLVSFGVGAAIAGAIGAFYASYASLVCPTEMALTYSVNLIIILYLGGRATLIGPVLGAVLFTALPEYLRVAQEWRLVVYGLLIVVGSIYMPDGIIKWASERLGHRRAHGGPRPRGNGNVAAS
jgi:ABC-type branched-subunit amino acid transport system permease subunit